MTVDIGVIVDVVTTMVWLAAIGLEQMESNKMGGHSSSPDKPPPTPVPSLDVATTAAEKALQAQQKASYGSMTAEDEQAKVATSGSTLGSTGQGQPNQTAAASAATAANRTARQSGQSMGRSAVVTG